ncbi:hypothetical protein DERF_006096 [Dermatophagoides farinae]|uniref:Uncharacterized protein n=1 Tax=Dermatophagoides farinae TaxID=6954 RepID=A0A922I4T9_DERFA|nr:hypothetical protein DERF_006096 [Dermatophagoides farinae]
MNVHFVTTITTTTTGQMNKKNISLGYHHKVQYQHTWSSTIYFRTEYITTDKGSHGNRHEADKKLAKFR